MAIFSQVWQFWEFLTYNFQTPLWIVLIFGVEVIYIVFFQKISCMPEKIVWWSKFDHFWPNFSPPLISRKPCIRFWWFFAQSCILMSLKKCSKWIFWKKFWFSPGGFTPKTLLWLKNGILSLYLRNRASNFHYFFHRC